MISDLIIKRFYKSKFVSFICYYCFATDFFHVLFINLGLNLNKKINN